MSEKNSRDNIIRSLLDNSFFKSAGGTSLSDIASSVKIKKSSIYSHFQNREDLLEKTTISCDEYINRINFIPDNIDEVAAKYDAVSVLTGIIKRYFKMHEKAPLFQIYTFIQSRKHFDPLCAEAEQKHRKTLIEQSITVLKSLSKNRKLPVTSDKIAAAAEFFVSGLLSELDDFLIAKKRTVLAQNIAVPVEDELNFSPSDEADFKSPLRFAEGFVSLFLA